MSDDKKLDDKVIDETLEAEAKKVEAERAEQATEGEVVKEEPTKPEKPKEEPAQAIVLTPEQAVPAYKTEVTDVMNPVAYQQVKLLATDLIKAKALPQGVQNAEQAFVLMWTGREMGMTPFDAINSLYIVNGAVRIYGKAVPGQMRKHGYTVSYKNETPTSVTIDVYKYSKPNMAGEKNVLEHYEETYTLEEAEKSGYTKDNQGRLKFGWKEGANRRLKLRYGALSLVLRTYIPDVLGPVGGIVEVDEDVETKPVSLIDIEAEKAKLKAAKTKEELGKIWSSAPVEAKNSPEYIKLKDELKKSFEEEKK